MVSYRFFNFIVLPVFIIAVWVHVVSAQSPRSVLWGSEYPDEISGIAISNDGYKYLVGHSMGAVDGMPNSGSVDIYLRVYDPWDNYMGSGRIASQKGDIAWGITTGPFGEVYVVGWTYGDLNKKNKGICDNFLAKFPRYGSVAPQWIIQWGSPYSDYATGVATDAWGNIYVCGFTHEKPDGTDSAFSYGYVKKFSSSGQSLWEDRFKKTYWTRPIAIDIRYGSMQPHIVGYYGHHPSNHPELKQYNIFTAYYDAAGHQLWSRDLPETPGCNQEAHSIAVANDGKAYITGSVERYSAGTGHLVCKGAVAGYDLNGEQFLYKTFGDADHHATISFGVDVDYQGNLVMAGTTDQSFSDPIQGGKDLFIFRYNPLLDSFMAQHTYGTNQNDGAIGVAVDPWGKIYAAGGSTGEFDGHPNMGSLDFLFFRYDPEVEE